MQVIGVDSAVQEKDNGLVLCNYHDNKLELVDKWERNGTVTTKILSWIGNAEQTLIAIDSPLGWPFEFTNSLATHKAGVPIEIGANDFFKRQTDLQIATEFNKRPLEVSADRIARTAFYTLDRIGKLRRETSRSIKLLWKFGEDFDIGFIEVYPASTILANGLSITGYKKEQSLRHNLLDELQKEYRLNNPNTIDVFKIEHDFDALVCCFSGVDFIEKRSIQYDSLSERIQKEGWIWARKAK